MFDISTVRNHLIKQIGYQNTHDTDELPLDVNSDITTAESGLYYNDEFSLLELANLRQISPFQEGFNYGPYEVGSTYSTGDKVKGDTNSSELYRSLVDNNLGNDLTDSNSWERIYPFSEWLERKTKAFINKFINELVNQRKLKSYAKTLLSDTALFSSNGRRNNTEAKKGRFVGFKIRQLTQKNTRILIDKLGFQFTQPQTDLPIYVYHSSQEDPIQTVNITTTKTNSFEWVRPTEEIALDYWSDDYNVGGFFYYGYYEDDLVGQAINYNYDYDKLGCQTCNYSQAQEYKKYARFVEVRPMTVNNVAVDRKLWDLSNDNVTVNKSFGLNMSFSVKCDLTDFLVKNSDIMLNALLVASKLWVCEEVLNNSRDNTLVDKLKQFAAINLDENKLDIKKAYMNEINSIDFDFSDLGTVCCPKKTKPGVRYGFI